MADPGCGGDGAGRQSDAQEVIRRKSNPFSPGPDFSGSNGRGSTSPGQPRLARYLALSTRVARTSGSTPKRTGSVHGSPVDASASRHACRAADSVRSKVLRAIPITIDG